MQYRGWVKCFGGGGNLAERNLGGSGGGKTLKNFEIFISEIAANASNFRNQLHLSIIIGGGPAPPLATAL